MIYWLCKTCGATIEQEKMPHTCPNCGATINLRLLSSPDKSEVKRVTLSTSLNRTLQNKVIKFIMELENIKFDSEKDLLAQRELIQLLEAYVVRKKGLGQERKEGN